MVWHLAELALYAIAAAVMVLTHRRMQRRMEEQSIRRATVLQKQAKAVQRIKLQAVSEFNKANERARHLHEDTQLMHQRADALLREARKPER